MLACDLVICTDTPHPTQTNVGVWFNTDIPQPIQPNGGVCLCTNIPHPTQPIECVVCGLWYYPATPLPTPPSKTNGWCVWLSTHLPWLAASVLWLPHRSMLSWTIAAALFWLFPAASVRCTVTVGNNIFSCHHTTHTQLHISTCHHTTHTDLRTPTWYHTTHTDLHTSTHHQTTHTDLHTSMCHCTIHTDLHHITHTDFHTYM